MLAPTITRGINQRKPHVLQLGELRPQLAMLYLQVNHRATYAVYYCLLSNFVGIFGGGGFMISVFDGGYAAA